jgi:nitrite reductase (NO-forming)
MHVGNGMYGLILVEPKDGLPAVDKEFYVMQGEFYTKGKFGEEGLQPFDLEKATDERPSYVVFNGAVGSLVGDKALKAKVGERVRLFVGNGGPNLTSSFHVIGEIFDHVYQEGGMKVSQENVQTTVVPAGGSVIVDFKLEVPGTFILVDHALFRAFNKGALAMLSVEGPQSLLTYSGKEVDATYLGDYALPGSADSRVAALQSEMKEAIADDPKIAAMGKELFIEKGKRVYAQTCFACHQMEGQGIPSVFPPLAKSDYLMADKARAIHGVIKGQSGEMTVNGQKYNGVMPPVLLTDEQIAHVLTFVRNSWGNSGEIVTVEEVMKARADSVSQ